MCHPDRPKGSAVTCVRESDERRCWQRLGSYRERTLRKLLGRVRECTRQWAQGRQVAQLVEAVTRTWPADLLFRDWRQAEQVLEVALRQEMQANNAYYLQKWRADMCKQGRAATSWIKGRGATPAPAIASEDGQALATADSMLSEVRSYWEAILHRPGQPSALDDLQRQEAAGSWRPAMNLADWAPAATSMAERARELAQTSPGLDGRACCEVAAMPLEVFVLFRVLVLRWAARRHWPRDWRQLRQAHLRRTPPAPPRSLAKPETCDP